jgi:hypothetical protein
LRFRAFFAAFFFPAERFFFATFRLPLFLAALRREGFVALRVRFDAFAAGRFFLRADFFFVVFFPAADFFAAFFVAPAAAFSVFFCAAAGFRAAFTSTASACTANKAP